MGWLGREQESFPIEGALPLTQDGLSPCPIGQIGQIVGQKYLLSVQKLNSLLDW